MKVLLPFCFSLLLATFALADVESDVLSEMNLARTAPQQYARILAERSPAGDRDAADAIRFLEKARPLAPLQRSSGLGMSSQLHVNTQGPTGASGHGNPFSRMNKFGAWAGRAGENISYGKSDARSIVCSLIIDKGVSGKGHRKNIFSSGFGVAGVAFGHHASYGSMCVIDFATKFVERGSAVASL